MANDGGTSSRSPRKSKAAPPKFDWIAIRERYVTGTESNRDIASALKTNRIAVERAAMPSKNDGKSWNTRRQEFRTRAAEIANARATKSYAQKLRDVSEMATDIARAALAKLAARLESGDMKDSDLIAVAKLATSTKLEVSGPEGAPIAMEVTDIAKLTDDELRTLAASLPNA